MDKVLEASLRTIEALEYQIASHRLRIARQHARIEGLEKENQLVAVEHARTVLKRMEYFLSQAERDLREAEERLACTGSEDTELGVLMGPEGGHGATEVYARVQA